MRDTYGAERLEAACARALLHASPFYRTVKTILAGGYDRQPLSVAELSHVHAPGARFVRSAQLLFDPTLRVTDPPGVFAMNPMPVLSPHLKQLRLSGILDSLEARNRQAIESKLAYTEFHALLVEDEVARREQKKFTTRL